MKVYLVHYMDGVESVHASRETAERLSEERFEADWQEYLTWDEPADMRFTREHWKMAYGRQVEEKEVEP